jgi:hypothetical protein
MIRRNPFNLHNFDEKKMNEILALKRFLRVLTAYDVTELFKNNRPNKEKSFWGSLGLVYKRVASYSLYCHQARIFLT